MIRPPTTLTPSYNLTASQYSSQLTPRYVLVSLPIPFIWFLLSSLHVCEVLPQPLWQAASWFYLSKVIHRHPRRPPALPAPTTASRERARVPPSLWPLQAPWIRAHKPGTQQALEAWGWNSFIYVYWADYKWILLSRINVFLLQHYFWEDSELVSWLSPTHVDIIPHRFKAQAKKQQKSTLNYN